jgi:TupA-like ATPgrasp
MDEYTGVDRVIEDGWLRNAPLAQNVCSLRPSPTSAPSRSIEHAPCVHTADPGFAGSPSCKDRAGRQTQRSVHHVPGHSPAGGLNLGRAPLLIKRALEPLVPRNVIGDRFFCWLAFLKNHRRIPKTSDPIYFSDHLFKIRSSGELYDPLRQITSDKILVKAYVAHFLGEGFTPATLGILASEMEVDTFKFPRPCVIKPSHASQLIRILKDENDVLDREELKHWLRFDYYRFGREANYRYVKHRIIVEELLCDSDGSFPNDF